MDRHMDNKHADRLHLPDPAEFDGARDTDAVSSGNCLGDLCPVLGCGAFAPDTCTVKIHAGGGKGAGAGRERGGQMRRGCGMCDPADMERRRHMCEALFRRYDAASYARVGRFRSRWSLLHFVCLAPHFLCWACFYVRCCYTCFCTWEHVACASLRFCHVRTYRMPR